MASDNVREFSRIVLAVEARLTLDSGERIAGLVHDLSMNGVYFTTGQRVPVDSEGDIILVFDPSDSRIEITGRARVMRSDGEGIAVQILQIELEGYEHLRNLILYNAPDPEQALDEIEHHLGLKRREE